MERSVTVKNVVVQHLQNRTTRLLSGIAVASSIPELPLTNAKTRAEAGLVAMDARVDATHAIRQRAADQPKRPEM